MRRSLRAAIATFIAVLFTATTVGTSLGQSAAPTIVATIESFTCNPAGQAGLEVTASAKVTGSTIRFAELWVGELGTVSDPAYVPFPWTGVNTANWFSRNSYGRTGAPTTETRTLRTTDPTTWDEGNHAVGIWSGSLSDSWWFVTYSVGTASPRVPTETLVDWWIACPARTVVDATTLKLPFEYVGVAGDRG